MLIHYFTEADTNLPAEVHRLHSNARSKFPPIIKNRNVCDFHFNFFFFQMSYTMIYKHMLINIIPIGGMHFCY